MLCSKRAKRPEGRASLGDSHVMKHLRLVPILAFVALFVAACGGDSGPNSVPSEAVAVGGGDAIPEGRLGGDGLA